MPDHDHDRRPHLTGGCQCGAVRYVLYAQPSRIGVCHCRMCQKATGAPFGVFAVVDAADFAWTRGKPASWLSSAIAAREFCAACGTPLGFHPLDSNTMEMMTGTLDQPERAPPTYEVGREAKLGWIAHLPSLPGKTTLESIGADKLARISSYQHPDHDTPENWRSKHD